MIRKHNSVKDIIKLNFTDDEGKATFALAVDFPKESLTAEELEDVGRYIAMAGFFKSSDGYVICRYLCAHREETTVKEV